MNNKHVKFIKNLKKYIKDLEKCDEDEKKEINYIDYDNSFEISDEPIIHYNNSDSDDFLDKYEAIIIDENGYRDNDCYCEFDDYKSERRNKKKNLRIQRNYLNNFQKTVPNMGINNSKLPFKRSITGNRVIKKNEIEINIEQKEEQIVEPIEEPIVEPIEEPVEESIEEPIEEPIEEKIDEKIEEQIDELIQDNKISSRLQEKKWNNKFPFSNIAKVDSDFSIIDEDLILAKPIDKDILIELPDTSDVYGKLIIIKNTDDNNRHVPKTRYQPYGFTFDINRYFRKKSDYGIYDPNLDLDEYEKLDYPLEIKIKYKSSDCDDYIFLSRHFINIYNKKLSFDIPKDVNCLEKILIIVFGLCEELLFEIKLDLKCYNLITVGDYIGYLRLLEIRYNPKLELPPTTLEDYNNVIKVNIKNRQSQPIDGIDYNSEYFNLFSGQYLFLISDGDQWYTINNLNFSKHLLCCSYCNGKRCVNDNSLIGVEGCLKTCWCGDSFETIFAVDNHYNIEGKMELIIEEEGNYYLDFNAEGMIMDNFYGSGIIGVFINDELIKNSMRTFGNTEQKEPFNINIYYSLTSSINLYLNKDDKVSIKFKYIEQSESDSFIKYGCFAIRRRNLTLIKKS